MFTKYIIDITQYINKLTEGNQMLAGAIGLWGLGLLTYFAREIPVKTYNFLVKHLTTEMVITSQSIAFHQFLKWLKEKDYSGKFRKIKLSNGRWGYDNETVKSVGYGSHIVWFRWTPIMIQLKKTEGISDYDKETITLTKMGRSHKLFDKIISEIASNEKNDTEKLKIYKYSKGWNYINKQPKRKLESIFIEREKIQNIIKRIELFIEKEQWYIDNGIPYQIGILLYGPPGTGKTSLIKAIAAHFDKTIAISDVYGLFDGTDFFGNMPDNSLLVIEDIDSSSLTGKRDTKEKNEIEKEMLKKKRKKGYSDGQGYGQGYTPIEEVTPNQPNDDSDEQQKRYNLLLEHFSSSGISGLLNAIDGIVSIHGRMMIMTTNHPEQLDEALIRPGRIDLKVEVGYVTMEIFTLFLERFFPGSLGKLSHRQLIKDDLTCSQLQECILNNETDDMIIEKFTRKNENERSMSILQKFCGNQS